MMIVMVMLTMQCCRTFNRTNNDDANVDDVNVVMILLVLMMMIMMVMFTMVQCGIYQ